MRCCCFVARRKFSRLLSKGTPFINGHIVWRIHYHAVHVELVIPTTRRPTLSVASGVQVPLVAGQLLIVTIAYESDVATRHRDLLAHFSAQNPQKEVPHAGQNLSLQRKLLGLAHKTDHGSLVSSKQPSRPETILRTVAIACRSARAPS